VYPLAQEVLLEQARQRLVNTGAGIPAMPGAPQ
jgi:hypothetical protein